MSQRSRTDLCGGRWATGVPTATPRRRPHRRPPFRVDNIARAREAAAGLGGAVYGPDRE